MDTNIPTLKYGIASPIMFPSFPSASADHLVITATGLGTTGRSPVPGRVLRTPQVSGVLSSGYWDDCFHKAPSHVTYLTTLTLSPPYSYRQQDNAQSQPLPERGCWFSLHQRYGTILLKTVPSSVHCSVGPCISRCVANRPLLKSSNIRDMIMVLMLVASSLTERFASVAYLETSKFYGESP